MMGVKFILLLLTPILASELIANADKEQQRTYGELVQSLAQSMRVGDSAGLKSTMNNYMAGLKSSLQMAGEPVTITNKGDQRAALGAIMRNTLQQLNLAKGAMRGARETVMNEVKGSVESLGGAISDAAGKLKESATEARNSLVGISEQSQVLEDKAAQYERKENTFEDSVRTAGDEDENSMNMVFGQLFPDADKIIAENQNRLTPLVKKFQNMHKNQMKEMKYEAGHYDEAISDLRGDMIRVVDGLNLDDEDDKERASDKAKDAIDQAKPVFRDTMQVEEDMYDAVAKGMDMIADLTVDRVKALDVFDAKRSKKEEQAIRFMASAVGYKDKDLQTDWNVQNLQEEKGVAHLEEKMQSSGDNLIKGLNRQYTALGAEFGTVDTSMENAIMKVEAAQTKVGDAKSTFAQGKANFDTVYKQLQERVDSEVDTTRAALAAGIKDVKLTANGKLLSTLHKGQANGLASLNRAQNSATEMIEKLAEREEDRKGEIKDMITKEKEDTAAAKADLDSYDTKLGEAAEETEKTRQYIDEKKSEEIGKIGEADQALNEHVSTRATALNQDMVPLVEGEDVDKIDHESEGINSEMVLDMNREFSLLPKEESAVEVPLQKTDDELAARKSDLGKLLKKSLSNVQMTVDKTGMLVNSVMPMVKKTALKKSEDTFRRIKKIEDTLKDGLKASTLRAAEAQHNSGSKISSEAAELTSKLVEQVRGDDDSHTLTLNKVKEDFAKQRAGVEKDVATMDSEAKAAEDFGNQVSRQLEATNFGLSGDIRRADTRAKSLGEVVNNQDLDKTLDDTVTVVTAEVKSREEKAKAEVTDRKTKLISDIAAMEKTVSNGASASTDQGSDVLLGLEDQYNGLFSNNEDKLRVMVAKLRGIPANEEEWAKSLIDDVRMTEKEAAEMAALSGKSRLEQQSAIDEKFKAILASVNQDVHEVDEKKQALITHLTLQAKKETERLLSSGKLSEEELAERMKKVNAWLVGQISNIHEQEHEIGEGAKNAEELAKKVEAEAASRANGLVSMMQKEDAKAGVQHDRSEFTQTSAMLGTLISDLSKVADTEKGEAEARVKDGASQHGMMKMKLEAEAKSKRKMMSNEMDEMEANQKERVRQLEDQMNQHGDAVKSEHEKMVEFVNNFDKSTHTEMEKLTDQTVNRESLQHRTEDFTKGVEYMGANSMANAAQLLVDLTTTSKGKLSAEAATMASLTQKMEKAMGSEQFQLLKQIGDADRKLDGMLESEEKAQEFKTAYEKHTVEWRDKVAEAVDSLGGGLAAELETMRKEGMSFQHALESDSEGMDEKMKEGISEVSKWEAGAISKDEASLDASAGSMDGILSKGGDIPEGFSTGGSAGDLKQSTEALNDALRANSEESKKQDVIFQQALEKKNEEAKAASRDIVDKLKNLKPSLLEIRHVKMSHAEQTALRRNVALMAVHEELEDKLKTLETEKSQSLREHPTVS